MRREKKVCSRFPCGLSTAQTRCGSSVPQQERAQQALRGKKRQNKAAVLSRLAAQHAAAPFVRAFRQRTDGRRPSRPAPEGVVLSAYQFRQAWYAAPKANAADMCLVFFTTRAKTVASQPIKHGVSRREIEQSIASY
jgi:hypothetical protein